MALSKKWDEAWNKNEAYGWVNLLHDDYQFTFHSSGNVMKKDMTVEGKITSRAKELIKKIRCDFENDKTLVANWNRCYVDLVIQDDYLNPDYTHLQRSHGCQSALNNVAVPNHEQRTVCICKISEYCSRIAVEQITTYLSGIADRG